MRLTVASALAALAAALRPAAPRERAAGTTVSISSLPHASATIVSASVNNCART
jgi:hypothetical protein